MWARSRFFQKLGGGILERTAIGALSAFQLAALSSHKNPETMKLIKRVRRERRTLTTAFESYHIHSLAQACRNLKGDFAEVGVYEGASAALICNVKADKTLHLFDTFDGLPESTDPDRSIHKKNQYAVKFDAVRQYLSQYGGVEFYRGMFPETAAAVEEKNFAFVHFDVDLYESTRSCLEFFYQRMTPGGIMLSHDYSILTGVQQAFHEFLRDKPEGLIELNTTQCMVVRAAA
ncbi:MAG: class I SAM-dependent methyltransferase [Planctomycetales bacterium]|nr:class I SAM-dependent methyltransferase [Planctomycetales bacterium]